MDESGQNGPNVILVDQPAGGVRDPVSLSHLIGQSGHFFICIAGNINSV